jgi:antitoxin (DNA-binding transcriptional repressor) of toxin-antitoxin stability system
MREQIGIRELRGDLARHVRRAAAGERTVIAVGGHPAAALGPLTETISGIEPLIAAGALVPPRRTDPARLHAPIPVWSGARLDRLLRELRG